MKPDTYTQTKKILFDWTDKKKYLIHYKMSKFYFKQGMVVHKSYEIISFNKRKWLENLINFKTQKRNLATNDFKKHLYNLLNQAFFEKAMENVKNRVKIEFMKM